MEMPKFDLHRVSEILLEPNPMLFIASPAFSEWLYGEYNEEKLAKFQALYSVPGLRNYMDYLLDRRNDKEYLERYGMDYSDIYDPRKLSQVNSGSRIYGSTVHFVSKNLESLYD